RGQVLPIGGLPEKLMAAQRAGVKTVLIPRENTRDLEDVPEETLQHLEVIPIDSVQEAVRHALGISLPSHEQSLFARTPEQELPV
ncbi:MAG: endopeptidase La, partial [Eubacterium sp.]|nr:endopeptidase La [Eubacterium sp.]